MTFDERVRAQEALDRVDRMATIGAPQTTDPMLQRQSAEQRVRTYLDQTLALERFWHTRVTAAMLRSESERMARGTRMPERLRKIQATLGNDPFLFEECVARRTLVDRLTRAYFESDKRLHPEVPDAHADSIPTSGTQRSESSGRTWDAWWHDVAPQLDETSVQAVSTSTSLPALTTCPPDDTWDNGSLAVPDFNLSGHTAVWTGSRMLVWGWTGTPTSTGWSYDPATDTWSAISPVGAPSSRLRHTAVWTGNRMIVWGGDNNSTVLSSGGSYDPTTDTWTPLADAAVALSRHTAVWTGSSMIVWGGYSPLNQRTQLGARYDPGTNTWATTTLMNAPASRYRHSAVWTGSRMIVWGGDGSGNASLATGGQYDPATDTWTSTSTTGAPAARIFHVAVWSGSSMIVWSGYSGTETNTGGRYDPALDSWSSMTTTGAPSRRESAAAVWSGTRMIAWGGSENGAKTDTGGLYDPVADAWSPISPVNAPEGRSGHSLIWTGTHAIAWGGTPRTGELSGWKWSGGRYDPATDSWTPTAATADARTDHTAVWTGTTMIAWGGSGAGGFRYDPALDSRSPVTAAGAPSPRSVHTAIWTGTRMLVWGGTFKGAQLGDGAIYNPVRDSWDPMSTFGAPLARSNHTAVWTGSEMLVWGGFNGDGLRSGGRYDPATDRWRTIALSGAPSARTLHSAVWTGNRMVVWGGSRGQSNPFLLATPSSFTAPLRDGAQYDPAADSWSATSLMNAPTARSRHTATWTGGGMVIWGGFAGVAGQPAIPQGGGRYDPATDTWTGITASAPQTERFGHTAVWTGSRLLVWGAADSGGYDPLADSWTPIASLNAPSARYFHSAVWANGTLIVFGGIASPLTAALASGGRYSTGQSADDDGDGFTECGGDCDDALAAVNPARVDTCNGVDDDCDGSVDTGTDDDLDAYDACLDCDDDNPNVHPGAVDVCDGLDNDCGEVADGAVEVCDRLDNDCNGTVDDVAVPIPAAPVVDVVLLDGNEIVWTPINDVRGYDVVRGNLSTLRGTGGNFTSAIDSCVGNDIASASITPAYSPGAWFYVTRSVGCGGNGTYDEGPPQIGSRDAEIAASAGACP